MARYWPKSRSAGAYKQKRLTRHPVVGGYLLLSLTFPTLTAAETLLSSERASDLDEVVVTATRERKALSQETRSVAVVDRAQITRQQASSVAEVLQHIPNVDVTGGPRANAQSPMIRGLDGNRILQVIDGVRQNTQAGHRNSYLMDPELLASIEVIKGPSGSLWGSGALGGVVAQRTLSAADLLTDNSFGGYLKQGYAGANNETKTSAGVYGLLGDSVDFLLNGYYADAANLRLGNGQHLSDSAYRNQGGMVKIGWQFDEAQRVELIARQAENNQTAPSNPAENVSSSVPLINQHSRDRNVTLDYHLNPQGNDWLDARLTAYINQTRFDEWRIRQQQHDAVDYQTVGFNLSNHSRIERTAFTYGVDFYQDRSTGEREGKNRPLPPDGRSQVTGAYWQADLPLVQHWSLLPGVRYDHYSTRDNSIADSQRTEQRLSPSVGLRWQTSGWLVLSTRYDEAFRAPSMEEMYTRGTHFCMGPLGCNSFLPNPDLRPETAKNSSITAQMTFDDLLGNDSLTFDATYFHNRVSNYIDQQVNRTTTQYVNVSNARLQGVELAARYRWQALETTLSYAQTEGKDRQSGQALQNIPARKWVADVGYHWFHDSLKTGATLRHYQTQDDLPANVTEPYPGYTLVDLYATWHPHLAALKDVQLDFAVDNLTDRYYRPAFSQLYAAGRNVKVSLKYSF